MVCFKTKKDLKEVTIQQVRSVPEAGWYFTTLCV